MYLVTGGSGFCGTEITKYLIRKNQSVRILDIEPPSQEIREAEFVQADIRDEQAVDRACRGIDKVIHTAAKVPISKVGAQFSQVNVGGTENVLKACLRNKVQKIVHLSSSAVQLSDINPVDEAAPYRPIGAYARSKVDAEKVCKAYITRGLKVDILRPRTVVGPGRLGIFNILFDWISGGKKIYITGNGRNKIQFLHSEDLAACCYLASLDNHSEIYNIGSKDFASIREDLRFLIDHAGTGSGIISLPVKPAILLLGILDILRLSPLASWHYRTFHKDFYFTNAKAGRLLGWQPQYGNHDILIAGYDSYLKIKEKNEVGYGASHRKALKQGVLKFLKNLP